MYEERHPYYHTCPLCGANLDPNESCDCQKDETQTLPDPNVTEKSGGLKNERTIKYHE